MKTRMFILIAAMLTLIPAAAQNRAVHFNLEDKVAVSGYDPVAYFKQGKAIKGRKDWAAAHDGVIYYFATAANKAAFAKNPQIYEPQYGGWCAFAMGDSGEKVAVDPETFKIVDGKLYLFYNAFFNNTLKSWNKNEDNLKRRADANWNKITH